RAVHRIAGRAGGDAAGAGSPAPEDDRTAFGDPRGDRRAFPARRVRPEAKRGVPLRAVAGPARLLTAVRRTPDGRRRGPDLPPHRSMTPLTPVPTTRIRGRTPLPAQDLVLSVLIPVYNERNTIHTILDAVHAVPVRKQVICVDDCSTDGTR